MDVDDLIDKGKEARRDGRLDEAHDMYAAAVDMLREQGPSLRLAHTVRHLGDICWEEGDHEGAESCFVQALAIYRSDSRTKPLDLANALRPYAILREANGHHDEARAMWTEARDLYEACEVEAGVTEAQRHLAALAG